MANLSDKQLHDPIKLLLIGDSGTGKTGALASLAKMGLELFILDFDNGTDILGDVISDKAARTKVHIETLTDTGKMTGFGLQQKILKANPTAFPTALGLLQNWKDRETGQDFGPVSSWRQDKVLCVDSLSFMGMSALDYVLAQNKRAGEQPWQSDWGDAMRFLEQTLQILYSTEIKCHIVVTSHIVYQQDSSGSMKKGLPMGLGQQLPPKIGRYFNTMLMTKSRGMGDSAKRVILTKPEGLVEVKCPLLNAPRELSIETGLADFFKLWTDKAKAGAVVSG